MKNEPQVYPNQTKTRPKTPIDKIGFSGLRYNQRKPEDDKGAGRKRHCSFFIPSEGAGRLFLPGRRARTRQKRRGGTVGSLTRKEGGLLKKTRPAKKKTTGAATQKTARYKYSEWITEEGLIRVRGWAQDGCTYEQIAQNIGIAYSTLCAWRERFPELSEALTRARDIADRKVENRLFDRTQGYTVKVKKAIKVKREWYDDRGKKRVEEHVEMVEEDLHIPADVKAQMFWLANRKPQEWRNNPDGKQDDGELPDDGLKEQLEDAAAKVCAGTDDSDMLPECEDDGEKEDA